MPSDDSFFYEEFRRRPPLARMVFIAGAGVVLLLLFVSSLMWRPPAEFSVNSYLTIERGETLSSVGSRLFERSLIRSPFWFKVWSALLGGTRGIKAGDYSFVEPMGTARLAWRLTHSAYALEPVSVTIPEGFNNREIAARLAQKLARFDAAKFKSEAKEGEGYLFPDTYRFLPNERPSRIVAEMSENFARRVKTIEREIADFGRPLREIIIMAALLEEEARTMETRQKIAGILWKRLENNMLLQVDAVFPYIFEGRAYDLTNGDLFVDSPYNTYKYIGLPPTAISNPGLDAIRAAITPVTTPYWYYLSDKEGNMHYAVTHDEHLINRERYILK